MTSKNEIKQNLEKWIKDLEDFLYRERFREMTGSHNSYTMVKALVFLLKEYERNFEIS